jgi:hypothetical protein
MDSVIETGLWCVWAMILLMVIALNSQSKREK